MLEDDGQAASAASGPAYCGKKNSEILLVYKKWKFNCNVSEVLLYPFRGFIYCVIHSYRSISYVILWIILLDSLLQARDATLFLSDPPQRVLILLLIGDFHGSRRNKVLLHKWVNSLELLAW